MRFPDFPHLFAHLERGAQPRTVAMVGAEDPHALEATVLAHDETCLSPILIGNRKRILAGLERLDRADAFPVLAARRKPWLPPPPCSGMARSICS